MELNGIINRLKQDNLNFNLYFCKKVGNGNYVSFSPNVDNRIYEGLINPIIEYISKFLDRNIVDYSPMGYEDETIERYNIKFIKNYKCIEQSFENADNVETEIRVEESNFYVLEIKSENEEEEPSIKIFRRLTNFKRLYSKSILAIFNGKMLNKIESKIVGIDGQADLLVIGEEVIVLSHYSLERIFNLETQFKDQAADFLNNKSLSNMIDNFSSFYEDCLDSKKYKKMLTKMSGESINLDNLCENSNLIKETIELFDLNIEYRENPFCFIYGDKSQIKYILYILRDSYYKSIINSNIGIDPKIVNTRANKKVK